MVKRFGLLTIIMLMMSSFIYAQEELDEEYIFVDGTVVNFPNDFLIYDDSYDELFIANDLTDMFFYVVYERTITSQELDSLPLILEWYFGDVVDYEIGDEDPITIGDREGVQYVYEVDSSPDFDRTIIALPIGDNGSVAVIRIQPNIENDVEEVVEQDLALSIVDSLRYVDFRAELSNVLGNSLIIDDTWMIEYPDSWSADEATQTLSTDENSILIDVYSPDEITALELKDDPIELLYYDLFAPVDDSHTFNPDNIIFSSVSGLDGIRYSLFDTVDGEDVRRVYFLAPLADGSVLALDMVSPIDTNILDDTSVQDILQTFRLDGTLPPISMMQLDNSFIIEGIGEVRYPSYWRTRETDGGAISMSTIDLNMYIFGFEAPDAIENGYPDDLAFALLDITTPADDNVVLNPDDVVLVTLQNGNSSAQLTYTDTNDTRTYERLVMTIRLDDDSVIFVGIIPQPGIDLIPEEALAEALAIVNTIGE